VHRYDDRGDRVVTWRQEYEAIQQRLRDRELLEITDEEIERWKPTLDALGPRRGPP
jgi:superfamily I DNA and RNA helicase